jgi:hypothetical protein
VLTDDAARAYVWGYPLVVMRRTRALHCSRTGPGVLNHRDNLATPASRTVVAPNNDTLYSSGWFDLGAGDVTVDVPPMDRPGRYWSVMLLDAYTHVAYACRRLHGADGTTISVTLDPSREWSREAMSTIPIGTATVWILARVMVDGPDDVETARSLQRAITVRHDAPGSTTPTTPLGPPNGVHTAGAGFFDELAAALEADPPGAWHPQPPAFVGELAGLDRAAARSELAAAAERGEAIINAHPFANDATANGWGTRRRGSDFGDDVVLRAAAAKFALAGHHPSENRSYVALADENGDRLDGSRPLTLRFAPWEPPCHAFWSLTVYGADLFFVPNELDRWAIGDRTPGLRRDDDGMLTIVVGGARPADQSNWLPAPTGAYRLVLRVYEGVPEVVAATWFPPPLRAS